MTSGSKALISANSHIASAIIANHFLPGHGIMKLYNDYEFMINPKSEFSAAFQNYLPVGH